MVDFPWRTVSLQEGKLWPFLSKLAIRSTLHQDGSFPPSMNRFHVMVRRWVGGDETEKTSRADFLWSVNWVWPPHRIPVTTKIIICLIGNPYKPSFTTVTVRGPHPKCESKRPCYCAVFFATWMFMMSHWRFLKHPVPVDPLKVNGWKMFFQRLLLLASGSVADLQGI